MKKNTKIIIIVTIVLLLATAFWPLSTTTPNQYIERSSGNMITEKVMGQKWLEWLYTNPIGEASMFSIIKRKFVSDWYGSMMDAPSSVKKITPFIKDFSINMDIVQSTEFESFNDFFTRRLKNDARPIDTNQNVIVSPADGKILAYADVNNNDFIIKGTKFNVASFLNDEKLARKYKNGSLIVVRLAPYDYHRFHFPVSGKVTNPVKIEGDLYSVNPIALKQMAEIFFINKREYITLVTMQFGDIIMAEVGATMVGSIINTYTSNNITKGDEKGYFKFGGSTVVLIFEKNKIQIDTDLLENTTNGLETEVKMGEKIAKLKTQR